MHHTFRFRATITALVGLLSGASAMFGVISNDRQDLDPVYLVLGGAAAAAAAGLTFLVQASPLAPSAQPPSELPSVEDRGTVRDVVFQAGLLPVAENLASLVSMSTTATDLHGKIRRGLVQTAAFLAGDTPCLAAFYVLERDPQDPKGRDRLTKTHASMETEELPDFYCEDEGAGSFLIDLALGANDRCVKDISDDPENRRIKLVDGYQSALFVPTRAGAKPKGLLIFQAADKGVIPEGPERGKFITIAHLIGACEAASDLVEYATGLPSQAKGGKNNSPSVNKRGGDAR
ncbi:hypothetical protein [Streptomyces sp. NPDC127119]|uniref:hypothetical protein n=1 Tax=Streptomyces sp. NPDC127119 TaxID=3345370 RepID=UPI00363E7B8F